MIRHAMGTMPVGRWRWSFLAIVVAVLERWLAGIPGTDGLRSGAPGSVVAPRRHQADRPYRLTFLLSAAGAGCFT
jgi:hypothetical protein